MSPYTTPIYDRTATDIANETAKGFFNVADWERIYGNSEVVHAIISFLSTHTITFDELGAPTITTIPAVADFNTFLANIERMREAAWLPTLTGIVEIKDDWQGGGAAAAPDYEDANDWERVLELVRAQIVLNADYRIYCGVARVGQVRFYQHRWRLFGWVPNSASPVRRPRTGIAISGVGLTRNNFFRRYD